MNRITVIAVVVLVVAVASTACTKRRRASSPGTEPGMGMGPVGKTGMSGQGPRASAQPASSPPRRVRLARELDTNRDGWISAAEIAAAPQILRQLDRDGDGKLSSQEVGGSPWRPASGSGELVGRSHPSDAADKKILAVLRRLDGERIGMMNVSEKDGRILRLLVEAIGAKEVVEMGTSNGYSGIWIALGLRRTGGRLTTFDIDKGRFALARQNFAAAGVDGRVKMVLGDAHQKWTEAPARIDLLFLDADKKGYIDYLNKLLPRVRPGGLVVAHNMRVPRPDPRYIRAITTRPELETIFLNMRQAGIGVSIKKRAVPVGGATKPAGK